MRLASAVKSAKASSRLYFGGAHPAVAYARERRKAVRGAMAGVIVNLLDVGINLLTLVVLWFVPASDMSESRRSRDRSSCASCSFSSL